MSVEVGLRCLTVVEDRQTPTWKDVFVSLPKTPCQNFDLSIQSSHNTDYNDASTQPCDFVAEVSLQNDSIQ